MEISASIPKDMTATLPAASVLPQLPIAGAGTGKAVKNFSSDRDGFSRKLSEAIDKKTKAEPIADRTTRKPQKSSEREPAAEPTATGLPVGLAGSLPTAEVPPNVSVNPDTTNSGELSAINSVNVSAEFAPPQPLILPETGNQQPVMGQSVMGQSVMGQSVMGQSVMGQSVMGQSVMGQSVMGQPALTALPVQQQTPVVDKSAVATQKITLPAVFAENAATDSNPAESLQTQLPQVSFTAKSAPQGFAKKPVVSPENAATTSDPSVAAQDTKPVDSRIQQDIVAVQISTQPAEQVATTSQTPTDSLPASAAGAMASPKPTAETEISPTAEFEPIETAEPAVIDKPVARPEQVATSQTEQESTEGKLGPSKKASPELNSTDKAEAAAVTLTPFEKALHTVSSPAAPEPAVQQPRQELHEVARQVMDGMIASTDHLKSSQVIITLKPEHLGEVTVKINVDGDRVTAAFHAASSEVRAILESSLPQLRQEMSQQGWKFDSEGVYGGMQQFLANQQQQQPTKQWQMFAPIPQRMNRDEYDETIAFSPTGRLQVMSAAAVDYRV